MIDPVSPLAAIIAYEQGDLDSQETVHLFASLMKNGAIDHLQGHYGRTAVDFVRAGILSLNGEILIDEAYL